jgi:hypothetical protein
LEDNGLYINFIKKQRTSRSDKMTLSLCSLPVDMVYQILDHLDNKALFLSVRNVCQRLNIILDSYHRYKVKFKFIIFFDLKKNFRVFSSPCVKTRLNNYKYALTHVITSEYNTLWGVLITYIDLFIISSIKFHCKIILFVTNCFILVCMWLYSTSALWMFSQVRSCE